MLVLPCVSFLCCSAYLELPRISSVHLFLAVEVAVLELTTAVPSWLPLPLNRWYSFIYVYCRSMENIEVTSPVAENTVPHCLTHLPWKTNKHTNKQKQNCHGCATPLLKTSPLASYCWLHFLQTGNFFFSGTLMALNHLTSLFVCARSNRHPPDRFVLPLANFWLFHDFWLFRVLTWKVLTALSVPGSSCLEFTVIMLKIHLSSSLSSFKAQLKWCLLLTAFLWNYLSNHVYILNNIYCTVCLCVCALERESWMIADFVQFIYIWECVNVSVVTCIIYPVLDHCIEFYVYIIYIILYTVWYHELIIFVCLIILTSLLKTCFV